MFTGTVDDTGTVTEIKRCSKESALSIAVNRIDLGEVRPGDSISVNGACLTVTSIGRGMFTTDASRETLSRTNLGRLRVGSRVNLERSLRAGDRMGGHIVNGHVDGVGRVGSRKKRGKSVEFRFIVPDKLSRYIVEKGSVAIDGVSLTVNSVAGEEFSVNIIPYTLAETTFGTLKKGSRVNIECDIIGKYVEKFITGARGKDTVYQDSDES
ncbi:MAG: riboflavin synthase [Thermodesulfobacteriota bacterium]